MSTPIIIKQIQIRRDTAANWLSANPVLADGEVGYETDTNKAKVGNGKDKYADLRYLTSGGNDGVSVEVFGPQPSQPTPKRKGDVWLLDTTTTKTTKEPDEYPGLVHRPSSYPSLP